MNAPKINGYTEEEAKNLVDYIWNGKKAGKTLTYLFRTYGEKHGRAKGSVRNYYYALMRNPKGDERVAKLLNGKNLSVEKIREFTDEETHEALKSILTEKSKGISVRRAILNIAGDDNKKMLRLQNKYRNILKKEPEKIRETERELGLPVSREAKNKACAQGKKSGDKNVRQPSPKSGTSSGADRRAGRATPETLRGEFLKRRLEQEINSLYERIAGALKEENARLKAENDALKLRLEKRY